LIQSVKSIIKTSQQNNLLLQCMYRTTYVKENAFWKPIEFYSHENNGF